MHINPAFLRLVLVGFTLGLCPVELPAQKGPEGKPKVSRGLFGGGKGTIQWPDGAAYKGEIEKRQAHGTGIMTYADGAIYEGAWQAGKRHGTGTMRYADGATFDGQWKSGWREGQGVYVGSDGVRWEGGWDDGSFSGQGARTWPNGQQESGVFQSNRLIRGVRSLSNGGRVEGVFHLEERVTGSLKSGSWTLPDGSRQEGFFASGSGRLIQGRKYTRQGELNTEGFWNAETGKPHGYQLLHTSAGKIEGYYNEKGHRDGWWRYRYGSGTIYAGRYEDGSKVGRWIRLTPDDANPEGTSTKSVAIYERGQNVEEYRWIYPESNFVGVPSGLHFKKGSPEWPKGRPFDAHSLDPDVLYLGTQGDAEGRADGAATAVFLRELREKELYPRQLMEKQLFLHAPVGRLYVILERTTWRAGRLVAAELGNKTANGWYYVGGVDVYGRPHGSGLQSRTTFSPATNTMSYDNENLEPVTHDHGEATSDSSYRQAWILSNLKSDQERAAEQRRFQQRQQARRDAERAEELEETRRLQADLARREALRQRSRDKAAAAKDRSNAAQAQRDQEMRGFQRAVVRHNRNLGDAFEETRRAQEAQRQAQERQMAESAEQQRLAREADARRLEAERRRQAEAAEVERQRLAAAKAARVDAERQRVASAEAVQREREAAEAERQRGELEVASRATAEREQVSVSAGPPEPTGLTPPPGDLPEVPKRGYSAWTRYAEARDGSGSPLVRLEYRVAITTGLGDEPYVNVAWRVTNLSDRPIHDVAIVDKHYTTEQGTKEANSGESFGIVAPGDSKSNLPDVIQAERLVTFQLEQPGIRLRVERGGPQTHWQTFGAVTYF